LIVGHLSLPYLLASFLVMAACILKQAQLAKPH